MKCQLQLDIASRWLPRSQRFLSPYQRHCAATEASARHLGPEYSPLTGELTAKVNQQIELRAAHLKIITKGVMTRKHAVADRRP